jgi:hypothetical protein
VARYFVESREHPHRAQPIVLREPGEAAVLALRPFGFRWDAIPKVTQYRFDVYAQETVTLPTTPDIVQGPATNPSTEGTALLRAPLELGAPAGAVLSAFIPSHITAFTPRSDQLAKLAAGRAYVWQVKGLDERGNVVAESPPRQFSLQPR